MVIADILLPFPFPADFSSQPHANTVLGFIEKEQNLASKSQTYFPVPWFSPSVFHTGTDFHFIPQRRSIIISSWRTKLVPIISEPRVWGRQLEFILADLRAWAAQEQWSQAANQEVPRVSPENWKMTIIPVLIKRRVISCQMTLAGRSESFIINYYFQAQMHLRQVSTPYFSGLIITSALGIKALWGGSRGLEAQASPCGSNSGMITSRCSFEEPAFLSLPISVSLPRFCSGQWMSPRGQKRCYFQASEVCRNSEHSRFRTVTVLRQDGKLDRLERLTPGRSETLDFGRISCPSPNCARSVCINKCGLCWTPSVLLGVWNFGMC